ncbi:HIRA-interacting protein 3 [Nannospalax galili]|uniref:HIRA interacting protein 3 n=1 Tax=Nannospalax galili TaxID=1026970 RepID=A0A8C6RPL9_NANGA|nr:HIRA-interacting protein 3 [Nannospalax galili]
MAPEDEMLEFTHSFFRGRPDLSALTHSIVRRKFLTHVGRNHLEPEEKQALKRLVEEELLKMQVDAGTTEEKLDFIKVKRPSAPCSDPERKRFRFNSESESSSAPSSPDCLGPPVKNRTAREEEEEQESPRPALKKAVESTDEEQQTDLVAKMGLEEGSEEEGEGSVRSSKVWKEENSEEDDDREKEQNNRPRKKAGTKNKPALREASATKKQAREESENSEEEPVLRRAKKVGGNRGTKSCQESEDSEEEVTLANRGDREPRAKSKSGERTAWEGMGYKQKSRPGRLTGDLRDSEEEKEEVAANSGDKSRGDEYPVQRKSEGRKQQSASSEDNEDSRKEQATSQDTAKTGKWVNIRGESDTEREMSEAEESPKGERKNRSSRKSSKKGKARSSSSSSDGSPEPKGQKASSRGCGEDHPAVVRLKRYIRACGAHRNYKKLLGSCRSHKERLSVLRAELEALGMKGNPSLEKCRALKEQREEAAEVASLDVANIISSSGRPRRRTAWNPSGEAASARELYHRTLDSEEERPRQGPPDWSHMRGIISSDGESS